MGKDYFKKIEQGKTFGDVIHYHVSQKRNVSNALQKVWPNLGKSVSNKWECINEKLNMIHGYRMDDIGKHNSITRLDKK